MTTSDEAQTASYMIAQLIARKKKAHAEAEEIILPALKIVAGCMLTNDAMEKVTKIPLSSKTIARRIEDMSEDIELQIKQSFNYSSTKWAIQLDETTDISNKAQLLAFLRFVDTGKIVNNYFFCKELKQRTTGADIFELVDENVMKYNLRWENCVSVCTDGAPAMKVHCMIHREMLVSKSVPPILVTTLDEVVKVVNYIKSNALRSRFFSTFCEAMDSDYKNLLFHTEVRWLSKGKVLNRFISMKNEIMAFINNEEINFPFMMSDVWWLRVSFLGDILDKLNSLNLNLQGAQENIITISTKLKAFKEKLSLWNLNIAKENFASFPMVQENPSKSIIKKEVEETLTLLSASFDKYFPYLDVEKMEWVVNPFMHCEIQHLEGEMQENLIDLKNDLVFKRLFTEKELSEFWLCSNSKFPKLSNAAIESLLPFGSSYLCEQDFSTLTEMKSKKRERLQMIDEEMRVCLSQAFMGKKHLKKKVNLHVKMPKLELPTFDGGLESWLSFKDLFYSAIGSNSQIPEIEKLQYLKGQLRGEALRLVNAFPITADNYVEVWQTLLTRYDNPKDLIFTQIDNALRLPKLADDNHKSMFKLLDSCNEIVRTVKVLGYQIDSLSDVFFVEIIQDKLDKTTRKQWELQNNPRVVPSIKDLMEFLEIRAKSLQNFPNKDANVEKHSIRRESHKEMEESSIKRETAPRMEVQQKQWGHPGRSPMDYSSKRRPCRICLNRGHAGRFHPENRNFNSVEFDEKLSPYEKSDLIKLIKENKEAFAAHKMDIGHIKADPIRIKLTSQTPISLKPFRPSFSDNIEIKRQIEELLKYNVIRPSYSSYASPAMLVNKRNEDKLSEANIFTTLDLLSGYHHLDIHPDDKEYTAFTTTHGLYEFNKLSFGLKNSPSQFQRVLRQILNKYDVDFCMNYFDDFIIFSNNFQEHLTHLKVILDICIKENIKLKLSKCKFATYQISFLGYEISNHQFSPSTNNIETIRKLNSPRNKKDLQRVLGSINIYSKFIPNYAKLRLPLNNLLKKDVKWKWDEECETAFSKLKRMITSKPILAIYNPKYPIHLYTDASQEQIGSILKQEQPDGLLKPIAYRSRRMTSYESNYCVTEQECLAIIDAVDFFLPYLDGVHFTIHTDHACLKYLKNIKNPKGRLFRWSLKLSMFDFEIKHIRGTENKEADFLSRYPIAHFVSDPELKQAQFDDNINDRKYTKFNGLLTIKKK
ncbi:hypothetical protein LAZ67_2002685 [Cordylochernes scorpioides]|uniref:Reverse transcriptase domain-containing protein n=1 Tax=Cordylochernes scorpioides TaxID=51811 RepID=A0ABY6K5P1_9ARAC|nr:hypothetical protein LAZ67_2002685 [Cordylochernes scorpioides]